MAITIQPARPEQLTELMQLLTQNQLPVEDLSAELPNFWLALDDDRLVGSVGIDIYDTVGLLRSLSVDAAYRNQSIARKLCKRAFEEAKKQHIAQLYLITTTADRYFQQLGFEPVNRASVPDMIARTSQLSGLCPASAIVMRQKQAL